MDREMDVYMHAQMDNGMYGWMVDRQKRCQADLVIVYTFVKYVLSLL